MRCALVMCLFLAGCARPFLNGIDALVLEAVDPEVTILMVTTPPMGDEELPDYAEEFEVTTGTPVYNVLIREDVDATEIDVRAMRVRRSQAEY